VHHRELLWPVREREGRVRRRVLGLRRLHGGLRQLTHTARIVKLALSPSSFLEYFPHWIEPTEASELQTELRETLGWEEREIVLFGRRILQPRWIAWAGDVPYRYSGQSLEPRAFSPALDELRRRTVQSTGVSFNHALVNRYRDGNDSMGFHADDEPELGAHPVVASLSLGATRRFVIAKKRGSERHSLELEHGSLLVMRGHCQDEFRHALPKSKVAEERINVTWRLIH
jgi:alkylated DNA repair dioxygenase AlkB